MLKIVIFGARSIALGAYRAVRELYQEFEVVGFLVSRKEGNPETLAGLPVYEMGSFQEKKVCVLVATPEDIQEDIVRLLDAQGFHNHICVDSGRESELMEKYYASMGTFPSIHDM